MVPWKIVEDVMFRSLDQLVEKDRLLFDVNVNERSLTHRLALYIEESLAKHNQFFLECDVDCEYNRSLAEIKKLYSTAPSITSADLDAVTIYPDIVVHRRFRQYRSNNILVIEAKKQFEPSQLDKDKLSILTKGQRKYEYQYGVFIGFSPQGIIRVVRYQNGVVTLDSKNGSFNKLLLKLKAAND